MSDNDATTGTPPTAEGTSEGTPTSGATDLRFFRDFVDGRRGEILDAALAVFSEEGFDRGTMRQIASRVGVSEPAIYRHFASKEVLFDEFVELAGRRLLSQIEALLVHLDPGTFPEGARAQIAAHRAEVTGFVPVLRVLVTEALRRPAVFGAWREHFLGPLIERLLGVVAQLDAYFGVDVPETDRLARTRFLMGTLQGFLITGFMFGTHGEDDYLAMVMATMGWTRA